VGQLDVRAADHADRPDDAVRDVLQGRLEAGVDGQHRGGAERVARVDAHGVHVLDEAHRDQLVLGVADDLQLQFLPAEDRLLDQDLADRRRLQAAERDRAQLVDVVDEAAAGPAHRVGGADDAREPDLGRERLGVLDRADGLGPGHVDAQLRHRALEGLAVLATLDDRLADPDHADAVFGQHPGAVQRRRQVEARLPAQVGQEGVRLRLADDLGEPLEGERLDVGLVRHDRVGHDGGRVGVDQDDLVAQRPQGLAGLGARVVKLAGLTDYDRT